MYSKINNYSFQGFNGAYSELAGKNIYPESEAIIIDEKQNLIAIGKSILSQEMMKKMNNGVAVKIRHRINK